ncbi:hypothetical protein A3K73_08820 [Candidatus Pacearchaeota archaeon RBG_13_36_9]|nr:MAG: hypothetical protein A3K73_08820 [Candidatus Pacearchaeota archaeon RBG_13_36_9]
MMNNYRCGNEELFIEFMNKIKPKDTIALVSHKDLDGFTCAKVLNKIVQPALIKFVHYQEINKEIIEDFKKLKIDKVIFTDIAIESPDFIEEIEKFSEVLMIDHHEFKKDYNSDKTVFINAKGNCAAFVAYELVSKLKNIKELEWMVALASISDVCFIKNKEFIQRVYSQYSENFNEKDYKKGRMWDILITLSLSIIYFQKNLLEFYNKMPEDINEIKKLEQYSSIVQKEIDENLRKYMEEREKIPGGWFFEVKSAFNIESFLATKISLENPDEIIILSHKKESLYKISARNNRKEMNMITLLKNVTEGFGLKDSGGHIPAAGASISPEDYEEFKKRLQKINLAEIKAS